ncbi:MAG: serine/threonine-protein kinase, partial [Blastocatellia bacterium]
MTTERWRQVEALYHAALEREPSQRAAFLDRACAGDEQLRRELESLLAAHDRAGDFLDAPALEAEAKGIAARQARSRAGQQLGHYRILERIGAGGMGEVYLAEDARLDRKVALKLLPDQFTTDVERLQRFVREAKAASTLNHPNIIVIHEIGHEIGETGETHYIAMEFIEGRTLRQQMKQSGIRPREALAVATQVASALAAAHATGIVHRDIKPENIMLRPDGLVKVLDFGLAKLTESRSQPNDAQATTVTGYSTDKGLVMGTPRYMSPEQARGQKVDARTDIFSLGVVLYEMIAGSAPFEGGTPSDVIVAILTSYPPPLASHWPEAPGELELIVEKALRKDREKRYQVIKDLQIDLTDLKEKLEFEARLSQSE